MKTPITYLFLIMATISLHSQPRIITIDEAVEIAISQNLDLQGRSFSLDTLRANRDNAWNAFLPDISVGGALIRPNETAPIVISPTEVIQDPPELWSVGFSASATLNFSIALFNGLDYTVQEYLRGEIEFEEAERKLTRDVRKTFYTLLELRENRNLMEQKIETARGRLDQAQRNFQAGIASEFDVLSAQVGYENLRPVLGNLDQAYQATLNTFKILLLGLAPTDEIVLEGSIDTQILDLQAEEILRKALESSLSIRLLNQQVRVLETSIAGIQLQAYTPFVQVSYSSEPGYREDESKDSWFGMFENDYFDNGKFTLSIGLNLTGFLPFSGTGVEIQGLQNTLSTIEKSQQQVLAATQVEVTNLYNSLVAGAQQIRAFELNEELATKAYDLAEEGYRTGVRTLLELQNSEDDLAQAQLDVVSAKVGYVQTLLELEYILGVHPSELDQTQE